MPDLNNNQNNEPLQAEIDKINRELEDISDTEFLMSKQGKTLMDYDLATERVNVSKMKRSMEASDSQAGEMYNAAQISGQLPIKKNMYEERIDIPKNEEQDAVKLARERVRSVQDKLTPELFKKYPEASGIYDRLVSSDIVDRQQYLQNLPDYYLDEKEAVKALGGDEKAKEEYSQYLKDAGLTSGYLNKQFPGLYNLGGSKENDTNKAMQYGLRNASFTRYNTDKNRTLEDIRAEQDKVQKYLKINKK